MIIGIIDLGSNTIRLSIYNCEKDEFKLLTNNKTMAGIISYIDNGILNNDGIEKICSVLDSYKELLHNFDIHEVRCFSTASLRLIDNKNEVLETVEKRTGIYIDLISGLEEAHLDFIGAKLFTDISEGIIIDIGGGSTELVSFKDSRTLDSFSMPIGSLSMYNRFVKKILPSKKEKEEIRKEVLFNLERLNDTGIIHGYFDVAIGVGGTIRAALRLINDLYDRPKDNRIFTYRELKKLLSLFKNNDRPTIAKILKIAPDRIHTLLPGMIVLHTILKKAGLDKVVVSKYGVREGYLYHKVLKVDKIDRKNI